MKYISVSQAAARLGVTPVTVRAWISKGRLAAVRLPGGAFRIEERALDVMMVDKREREVERIAEWDAGDGGP